MVALLLPRVVYTALQSDDVYAPVPTASSFLLSPDSAAHASTGLSPVAGLEGSEASKYGTFRTARSTLQRSAPTTRAATPAPSTAPDSKVCGIQTSPPSFCTDQHTRLTPSQKFRLIHPGPRFGGEFADSLRTYGPRTPLLFSSLLYVFNYLTQVLALILKPQALCIIILLFGRVINLALPFTLGQLVRIFEGRSEHSPWPFLFGYVGLRFLQGSGGLPAIRDVNAPSRIIEQYPDHLNCSGSVGSCDAIFRPR